MIVARARYQAAARYDCCQGPVTGRGPEVEKHCPIGLGSYAKHNAEHNSLLSHLALRVEHPF